MNGLLISHIQVGQNLLGKVLTEVRNTIKHDTENKQQSV